MKGLFIPEITTEMFKNGCLESIEALMAEGEMCDIEYSKWIPISERLPEIGQRVLCSTNGETKVFVGHRCEPTPIWQVTEEDGRKNWVYDPEAYTDDVDSLPKGEDCSFDQDSEYSDVFLTVSSLNYDNRFESEGVTAWQPLPEPYKAESEG